ncbi:thiamine phosphate synthase [Hippea maritima]|uniref:Thiamine-phosphate synthase n=1 Tax=Hippea maritima (strain ATCC 700847 / DSM 10411 / MH2) TaxID=760142 RepID=F2LU18_HIPMA|nr:thiamine phosphate synthase [Hippea maritima]AEA33417.1 Thiamine-phosphate pyrophosphorylase [Hippea maritima DSM 10411]
MDLPKGFYGIIDERFGCIDSAKKLIDFGAKIIQYRCKNKTDRQMLEEAETIRRLTLNAGAVFIIDDRVDLALLVGADGVHVGDKDFPPCRIRKLAPKGFIIGLSTHSIDDVRNASCCDYIGVGPVFATTTKDKPHPTLGVELAEEMVRQSPYPAFLIGGIALDNIETIKHIPAWGFVSVRDVLANDKAHFERMLEIWNS